MSESGVLRSIIAALLCSSTSGVISQAKAASFCTINSCYVTPPAITPGYGGGDGGGGWGNDGNSGDPERQYRAQWCMDFPSSTWENYGCDIYSPPTLAKNGCGTAGRIPVPDFLVSPVNTAIAVSFGGIFTEACNRHDECYGTAGNKKDTCDANLYNDMVATASLAIPGYLSGMFDPVIRGQAWAYSRFLQWEYVRPRTSGPAFNKAQDEAWCRRWSKEHQEICSQ